jgi:hypothetical protein
MHRAGLWLVAEHRYHHADDEDHYRTPPGNAAGASGQAFLLVHSLVVANLPEPVGHGGEAAVVGLELGRERLLLPLRVLSAGPAMKGSAVQLSSDRSPCWRA